MRLKFIGCKVLTREIGYLSSQSKNFIDITWIKQGYHNNPDILRLILQECIDKIDENEDPYTCDTQDTDIDAILLGYGLCSNGVCGIKSKKYKIVIPKAHDCITLFLGSKERYKSIFDEYSGGIFWYTPGWVENCMMPGKEQENRTYLRYVKDYGEDNADYLMEMNEVWMKEYKACAYVEMDYINTTDVKEYTKACANHLGWEFLDYVGDKTLLHDFLEGNWDSKRFLVVNPTKTIEQSYDDNVIKST